MRNLLILITCFVMVFMADFAICTAAVNFSTHADWQADEGNWPSGIAWGDIDNNGWLDFATGVGIDLATVPDKIYFNYNGHLSLAPGWVSEYAGYSACIQLGDLDNDGDVDMVVPGVGYLNNLQPVSTVIYYNDNGFPLNPDYQTEPALNIWSMDLGDIDGDGDLDMVLPDCGIATDPRTVKIYYNNDGVFNTTPDWESDNMYRSVDAEFADVDLDGDLDMAVYGHTGLQIFYNLDGVLETTPSWTTTGVTGGFQIAFGDYDDDGDPDIATSGGTSTGFSILENVGGTFTTYPVWTCTLYPAAGVSWGDVDDDGDLDLVGAGWQNAPVGVFENVDGTFSSDFVFTVDVPGWPQLAILADFDEDMLVESVKNITSDGTRKLFTLKEVPIHEITSIMVDDVPLDYSEYCYHLEGGWVSLASAPSSGSEIAIHYSYSRDLDLAIGSSGAYIFKNQLSTAYFPTYSFVTTEFVDDNEDGFFDPGETSRFYFSLNNEHAPDYDVTVTMTSSNPEIVFTNSSVFFPVIEGDNMVVDNLSDPIEYIIPDIDQAVYDTFYITIESSLGTYRDQFQFIQEVGRTEILLIDDDGGGTCEEAFCGDLFDQNMTSHIWTTETRSSPTAEMLNQYRIVFWFTGAEGTDRLQADDITAMQGFLDEGGYLFLSGLGLAGELSVDDPDFLENYLHCSYSQDRSYNIHDGLAGSIFDDLQIRLATGQTVPGMEKILMENGGQAVLKFNNTSSSYSAVTFADYYRIVYITWGYELISSSFTGEGYASRQEVLQRILGFFPSYVCGDTDSEGLVNILDIVYLINYLYKNGPTPDPLTSADVDNDGNVNILDIVYLINFLYKNGPDPNCP